MTARETQLTPETGRPVPAGGIAAVVIRDALDEWLQALTSAEQAAVGSQAPRETLTLSVA